MKNQGAELNTKRKKEERNKKKNGLWHQTGVHLSACATNFLIIISFHFWKDQTIPNPTQ